MIIRNIPRLRMMMGAFMSLLLLASCSSSKSNLAYFQDLDQQAVVVQAPVAEPARIVPDDELLITVTSAVPAATAQFNLPATNPATQADMQIYQSPRQLTYIVDSKGDIDFPQLGRIHVAGMTTEQLRDDLLSKISKWVEDPQVYVQMMNFRVNVLGEVGRPGVRNVHKNSYSILEAIADSGDLTPYGQRQNVLLIRQENGVQKRIVLDLTSSDLLTSEYFYLRPNDYIYVQPNKVREGIAKYDNNKSYKLSMVSTVVSAASVIASLVIALAVK